MSCAAPVVETSLANLKLVRRGKVRDVYAVDEQHLLIVATDRISAFDCILPTPIPRKGEVLTALSRCWFDKLSHVIPNHLVTTEVDEMPASIRERSAELRGRSMFVRRTDVFPIECVVRGYLAGSGWKDYQRAGEVCGYALPEGMLESERLPEPLFTPSTKAFEGHDENIDLAQAAELVGSDRLAEVQRISLALYS